MTGVEVNGNGRRLAGYVLATAEVLDSRTEATENSKIPENAFVVRRVRHIYENNLLVREIERDATHKVLAVHRYKYDQNNRLYMVDISGRRGENSYLARIQFERDELGQEIKETKIEQRGMNETGPDYYVPVYKYVYSFDDQGRVVQRRVETGAHLHDIAVEKYWHMDTIFGSRTEVTTRDLHGKLVSLRAINRNKHGQVVRIVDGDAHFKANAYNYSYDNHGNVSMLTFRLSNGAKGRHRYFNSYESH